MATLKDNKLIQKIKAMDNFMLHLWLYIIVNAFLWLPWLVNGNISFNNYAASIGLIWGVVLIIHYIVAYRKFQR